MASGEMTMEEFMQFLEVSVELIAGNIVPGAISYICMDWRHAGELLRAAAAVELEHKQLCVWVKTNAGMGSLHRSQHELIFVFKKPGAEHINNFGLGGRGRLRSNVYLRASLGTRPGAGGSCIVSFNTKSAYILAPMIAALEQDLHAKAVTSSPSFAMLQIPGKWLLARVDATPIGTKMVSVAVEKDSSAVRLT